MNQCPTFLEFKTGCIRIICIICIYATICCALFAGGVLQEFGMGNTFSCGDGLGARFGASLLEAR